MPNYTLPTNVTTLSGLFTYAHGNSMNLLGNLILTSVFLIFLFRNIQIDGFKKRITSSFVITTVIGLFLFTFGIVSSFVFGIFVTGAVLTVLWVGFTD